MVSKHITYDEATRSDVGKRLGISNKPNTKQLVGMKNLATHIFESIREHFGVPIYISSFFRSSALNIVLHGATGSQHLKGEAIDIDADVFGKICNKDIFNYVLNNLTFDQLIDEGIGNDGTGGWVHISLTNGHNRQEVLIMTIKDGKKYYEQYKG